MINIYESLSETTKLPETEKTSLIYNAVESIIPAVPTAECIQIDTLGNSLNYNQIKNIILRTAPRKQIRRPTSLNQTSLKGSSVIIVDSLGIIKVNAQIRVESIATTVKLQQTILLCAALIQGKKAENEMYSLIKEDTEERGRDTTST